MTDTKPKGRDPLRSFRVPDDEWERWREAATKEKLTISKWLRKLANKAAKRAEKK